MTCLFCFHAISLTGKLIGAGSGSYWLLVLNVRMFYYNVLLVTCLKCYNLLRAVKCWLVLLVRMFDLSYWLECLSKTSVINTSDIIKIRSIFVRRLSMSRRKLNKCGLIHVFFWPRGSFPTGIPTVFAPEVDRESSRDFEWTDL